MTQDYRYDPVAQQTSSEARGLKMSSTGSGSRLGDDEENNRRDADQVAMVKHLVDEDAGSCIPRMRRQRDKISPTEAASVLLKHVSVDPDGGVHNLATWKDTVENVEKGQRPKIVALEKEGIETILAVVGAIRLLGNPLGVLIFSVVLLRGCFFDENFKAELELEKNELSIWLPVRGMTILMNAFELLFIVYFLAITAKNAWQAYRAKPRDEAREEERSERYVHLSRIIWEDIPHLQNFSSLKVLSMVHPALVARNMMEFSTRHNLARQVLEEFFMLGDLASSVCDEEIMAGAGELIVAYHKDHAVAYHKDHASKGGTALLEAPKEPEGRPQLKKRPSKSTTSSFIIDEERPLTNSELLELASSFPHRTMYHMAYGLYRLSARDHGGKVLEQHAAKHGLKLDATKLRRMRQIWLWSYVEKFMWLVIVFACYTFGTCFILVKTMRINFLFRSKSHHVAKAFFYLALFMNQVVGVISVMPLLRWRVEAAVFGGQDAYLSAEERYIVSTWRGLILEKVIHTEAFGVWEKLAVFLQLDDNDIQQLVMEEETEKKHNILGSLKRYMKENAVTIRGTQCGFLR